MSDTDEVAALAVWLANADGFALYRPQAERMLAAKGSSDNAVKWTPPVEEKARAMWIAGVKRRAIAQEIGCSARAITAASKRYGWPSRGTKGQNRGAAIARAVQAAKRAAS